MEVVDMSKVSSKGPVHGLGCTRAWSLIVRCVESSLVQSNKLRRLTIHKAAKERRPTRRRVEEHSRP